MSEAKHRCLTDSAVICRSVTEIPGNTLFIVATPPFHWKINSDATAYTSTVTVGGGVYEADGFSTRVLKLGTQNLELIQVDVGMFPLREFLHLLRPDIERRISTRDYVDRTLHSYTPTDCTAQDGNVSLSMRIRYSIVHEAILLLKRHRASEHNHTAPKYNHPQRKPASGSLSSGNVTPLQCCYLRTLASHA